MAGHPALQRATDDRPACTAGAAGSRPLARHELWKVVPLLSCSPFLRLPKVGAVAAARRKTVLAVAWDVCAGEDQAVHRTKRATLVETGASGS